MINRLKSNTMKKTITIIAILVLAISNGFSQGLGDFVVDNIIYKVLSFDDMTVQALGLEQTQTIVTIPSSIEYSSRNFMVTEANICYNNTNIESLTLAEGIIRLNLTNSKISELDIPSSLLTIDTLKSTNSFNTLIIPENVVSIYRCLIPHIVYLEFQDGDSELELFTFSNPNSGSSGTFYEVKIDTLYFGRTCVDNLKESDLYFSKCHIKHVTIGNNVKLMPCFRVNDFERITIPSSVEKLKLYSLLSCNNLETIVFEDNAIPIEVNHSQLGELLFENLNIKKLYLGRYCSSILYRNLSLTELSLGTSISQIIDPSINYNFDTIIDVHGENAFVKVYQMSPPIINATFSNRTFLETPLYVPSGTKELFQQANIWKNFFHIYEFEWDNPKCCVKLSANVDTIGNVIGQGLYDLGNIVTVKAMPKENYVFVNWTENDSVVSNNADYSFVVSKNRELVANFAAYNCSVNIHSFQGTAIGSGNYHYGDTVTVKAFPDDGYVFHCWLCYDIPDYIYDTVSFDNPYSFVITKDMHFSVRYSNVPFGFCTVYLSSDPNSGGIIQGDGVYSIGSEVTINAIPNDGYAFVNWTENDEVISMDAEYSFVVYLNKRITAHFSGLGVEDNTIKVSVYPNPTDGLIKIEEKEVERIEVYNIVGQLIKKTKENVLDISDQEAGTYIIKVITASGINTKQIIKN